MTDNSIVRYADDFKIFCRNCKDADRAYHAVKDWLLKRLKLESLMKNQRSQISGKETVNFWGSV